MTLKEVSERALARQAVLDAGLELTGGTEPTSDRPGFGSYAEDYPDIQRAIVEDGADLDDLTRPE